jgi:hypothetical protein
MDVFEEYKLFVESTQFLTERRQAAAQTYLALNTAIFAVLAFLVKDAGLRGWWLVLVSVPMFVVGIIICGIWERMIVQYKHLISWRYEQLKLIEAKPEMTGCHQFYLKEANDFFKPNVSREYFGFSRLERYLPRLFLAAYSIYVAGLVIATAAGYS